MIHPAHPAGRAPPRARQLLLRRPPDGGAHHLDHPTPLRLLARARAQHAPRRRDRGQVLRRLDHPRQADGLCDRELLHRAGRRLLRRDGGLRFAARLRLWLFPHHALGHHHRRRRLHPRRHPRSLPPRAAARALPLPPRVPAPALRARDRRHAPLPPPGALARCRQALSVSLLATRALTVRFGGLVALDGVDVEVTAGETVGVIGPNGSGKTTFFNALTGLYATAAGEILFEGRSLTGLEPHFISRLGIARTFQSSRLCLNLSVFDNVLIGMHARRRSGLLDFVFRRRRFLDEMTPAISSRKRRRRNTKSRRPLRRRACMPISTLSKTERLRQRRLDWKVRAMPRREMKWGSRPVRLRPSKRISPAAVA